MSILAKIGKLGKITTGEYSRYFVRIDDDSANTGGFLVLCWLDGTDQGFDNWVECADDLDQFFVESGWNVQWLE